MTTDELASRLAHVSQQIELAESAIYVLQDERYQLRQELRVMNHKLPASEAA